MLRCAAARVVASVAVCIAVGAYHDRRLEGLSGNWQASHVWKGDVLMLSRSSVRSITRILLTVMLFAILTTTASAAAPAREVILATTTSTADTGLLDALIPIFERKTG